MKFGVFDHVDRGEEPLAQHYENRLRLTEVYDRAVTKLTRFVDYFERMADSVGQKALANQFRIYVRRLVGSESRRGVVFVKEIVPRWAIAEVARWVYNENYVALPMDSHVELPADRSGKIGRVEYSWGRPLSNRVCAEFAGEGRAFVRDFVGRLASRGI